jgi:F0F1-type ATP synthase membrane subunit b/b'
MDINNIIPDSPSDLGAIVFWVIVIILVIAAIVIYLRYRKMSKKVVKMQENIDTHLNTIDQMKKSKEERSQDLHELKNKVDKMIDDETKKL